MIVSIDAGKAFDKNQHLSMIKKENLSTPQHNVIHDKSTANIILNRGNLKSFPLNSRMRQGYSLLIFLFNTGHTRQSNETRKIKGI